MKNSIQSLLLYSVSFFLSALITFSIIPTVKADTLSVSDDTFIDLVDRDSNWGTNPSLNVTDIVDRKSGERYVFLRFDSSIMPKNEKLILNMASLKLWIDKVHEPGELDIYLVEKPWDEYTLTANTAPLPLGNPIYTIPIYEEDEGKFLSIDITRIVEIWLDDPKSNFGIALVPHEISIAIDSKENGQTSHPAEIEIIHEGVPGPTGPQGEPGATGPQGIQGPAGQQGPSGNDGLDGLDGADGQDGINCWDLNGNGNCDPEEDINIDENCDVQDCQGPQGEQGLQGEIGLQGEQGPQGEQGIKGDTGDTGATGPTGPQGEQGPQGEIGPQGEQGPQGDAGLDGSNCWDLNADYICDLEEDINQDLECNVLDCQGPQGEQGLQGETGPQGEQGPIGPQGSQGEQGPIGDQGPKGDTGETGATGPTGSQGSQGLQGEQGPQGDTGTDGIHCWDLNGNGSCDPEEDINIDENCDTQDCQGPRGPAGINEEGIIQLCNLFILTENPAPLLCLNCGNGYLEPLEECDDGNLENGDECSSSCTILCILEDTRECSNVNTYGECFGIETCESLSEDPTDPENGTGWGECNALVPSPEICNGIDDDCDGAIDNDCSNQLCTSVEIDVSQECSINCGTDPSCLSSCLNDAEVSEQCTNALFSLYLCAFNNCAGAEDPELCTYQNCPSEWQAVFGDVVPTECNSGESRSCGYSDVGACSLGTQSCIDGFWSSCAGDVNPIEEICGNDVDEDCDGYINNDCPCNDNTDCRSGQICVDSQCIYDECAGGCSAGEVCADGQCVVQSSCGDGFCDASQGEDASTCPADCGECGFDTDCPESQICQSNECQPCVCPEIWEPVCGEDGTTYGNSCFARCAHVEIAYEGECGGLGCGDGFCDASQGEDASTCPADCEQPPQPDCGDGFCDASQGEDASTCPADCEQPPQPACGDGFCDASQGEDASTCPADCGECGFDTDCPENQICQSNDCQPCVCPAIWEPVCGVDGTTYDNSCLARCAHVEIAYEGECSGLGCGDGFCDASQGEDASTCPADCEQPPQPDCGDGFCDASQGEDASTCPADCEPVCADDNPLCNQGQFYIGAISGDTNSDQLSDSWINEEWMIFTVTEDNNSDTYLSSTITLTSAPGTDFDLFVYCESCGGTLAGSSLNRGSDDIVHVRKNDTLLIDDDFDVIIEVRHYSSTVCDDAPWELMINGNTVVSQATCN